MNIKVLSVILATVGLAACSEPVPIEQWKLSDMKLTQVAGLEDCRFITLKIKDPGDSIYVIRCPNSSTDVSYTVPRGKGRATVNVSTIDDADPRTQELANLEAAITKQQELIDELKKRIRHD